MKILETRTRADGMRARRYELPDGRRLTTFELPASVIKALGQARVREYLEAWSRGERRRAQAHARRMRIEELLRERVKPLAIAHEVGVSDQRVRQIRKEMGL